jgi:two-component system response regulator AtoC
MQPHTSGAAEGGASADYDRNEAFAAVLGESLAIRAAVALARRVAQHPGTTVLLHGETGTGKELFSRGIHYAGAQASEPYVAINCSAIPENLLESELFGHERGAFTDARNQKIGLLELAGQGTVFLDEIDELPFKVQPKLLRVLEERRVRRLGGLDEHAINCRVIAGTNSDMTAAVAAGRFREDLFYRLSVFRIELPALRMREDDIELLARNFVTAICAQHAIPRKLISSQAISLLRLHPWPGNVRELKNTMERAVIVADGAVIDANHITLQRRANVSAQQAAPSDSAGTINIPAGGMTLDHVEREVIAATLRIAKGNRSHAARMLGISRPTLIRKIREHNLASGTEAVR